MPRICYRLVILTLPILSLVYPAHSEPPPAISRVNPEQSKAAHTDLYGDPLPPRALARLGSLRLRHLGCLSAAAYSPDGKILAAGSDQHEVTLWELPSGRPLRRFAIPGANATRLLFSPDGKWLASAANDYGRSFAFQVWDVATGKEILQHPTLITALSFSADSKSLVTADSQHNVRVWDPSTGQARIRYKSPAGTVQALALISSSRILAVVGDSPALSVWEITSHKKLHALPAFPGPLKDASPAAFSPDRQMFATEGPDHAIALWDVATGKELRRLQGANQPIFSLAFSPDGKTLAAGDWGWTVHLWDLPAGKQRLAFQPFCALCFVAFSPDGKRLAIGGGNGPHAVCFWDAATGQELCPFPGHLSPIGSVAFSPDGKWVASASWIRGDRIVRLWNAVTGRQVREFHGHQDGVLSLAFSPDGKTLASSGWTQDATVRLWDVSTGSERRRFEGAGAALITAFSPDGKRLAAADSHMNRLRANDVWVWEVDSGKQVFHRSGPEDTIHTLAFSPDGRTLAQGGSSLQLWDVGTGQARPWRPQAQLGVRVWSLAFSPDGEALAVAYSSGPTRLWELATQCQIFEFPEGITVAFAPNGRFLAIATTKGLIPLFDLVTGRESLQLQHDGRALTLAFSPRGRYLTSGGEYSTALVWDVSDLDASVLRRDHPVTREVLDRWWSELGQADSATANRAAWNLVAAREQAISLLQRNLQPADRTLSTRIARLIAQLDDANFRIRDKATEELQRLGDAAEPALRYTLAAGPSAEVAIRIQSILGGHETTITGSEYLRGLRAVTILERIGSPEAQMLLKALAQGASEAGLTQEAKLSLQRLAKRRTAAP